MATDDISIIIPRLIRRIRLEKSLSQEDLANLAGLDRTYISSVERSRRNLTMKSLSKILTALDMDAIHFAQQLINEAVTSREQL